MNVRAPIFFPSLKSSTEPLDTRVSYLSTLTSGSAFVELILSFCLQFDLQAAFDGLWDRS